MFRTVSSLVPTLALLYCVNAAGATKQQISDEEATQFASELTTAIENVDASACERLIRVEFDMRKLLGEVEFRYQDKEAWISSFEQRLAATSSFGRRLLVEMGTDCTYRFVSTRIENASRKIVMRGTSQQGDLYYHILALDRSDDGTIKATAFENVGAGGDPRDFVQFIARRYAPWETPDGMISEQAPDYEMLSLEKRVGYGIVTRLKTGDSPAVLALHGKLPRSLKRDPYFATLAMHAAIQLQQTARSEQNRRNLFLATNKINEIHQEHSKVPSIALMAVDCQIADGEIDKALEGIAITRSIVGDDPMLQITEGRALVANGNIKEGITLATKGLVEVPEIPEAYLEVAGIHASVGDFVAAVQVLDQLYTRHQLVADADNLSITEWQKLFASEEFQDWIDTKERDRVDQP